MTTSAPPPPKSLPLQQYLAWLLASLFAGTALGVGAAIVQQRFSPLLLFPMLWGAACGAMLGQSARWAKVGHRKAVIAGAVLAVVATVGAFHEYSFRLAEERAIADAQHHAQLLQLHPEFARTSIPPPAASLWQFLSEGAEAGRPLPGGFVLQGAGAWAMWAFEAALVLAAALAILIPWMRQPYCDRCRSWFRTVRRGSLSRAASHWASGCTELPGENLPLEYRLLACDSGCGPTALELSWPVVAGERGVIPAGGTRLWLSDLQRGELIALLDAEARQGVSPAPSPSTSTSTDGPVSGARLDPPEKT